MFGALGWREMRIAAWGSGFGTFRLLRDEQVRSLAQVHRTDHHHQGLRPAPELLVAQALQNELAEARAGHCSDHGEGHHAGRNRVLATERLAEVDELG